MTDLNRNATDGARPVALKVVEDAIPAELKSLARWATWRYHRQDDKWKKVPLDARTSRWMSVTDPDSWASFDEAIECYRRPWIGGIGFVLAEGDPFTGVDLDQCRDPVTGALEPWAWEIIDDLDSYTEASPSGTGIKILVQGELTRGSRSSEGRHRNVFTGPILHGHRPPPRRDAGCRPGPPGGPPGRPGALARPGEAPGRRGPASGPRGLTDDEVIERAGAAKNGHGQVPRSLGGGEPRL